MMAAGRFGAGCSGVVRFCVGRFGVGRFGARMFRCTDVWVSGYLGVKKN